MKRLLSLVLALIMMFTLCACNNPAPAEETASEVTSAEEKEAEAKEASFDLWADDEDTALDPNVTLAEDGTMTYKLSTKSYSHWYINEEGGYDYLADNKIKTGDDWYYYDIEFSTADTAFIVMDPWCDWADDYLNKYFGAITEKTTLPLMQAAAEKGHKVIILTNDPAKIKYNTKITPGLQELVDAGKAELLYHTDWPQDKFIEMLDEEGITKLIYTGYASNMCVITRDLGISKMIGKGKQLYFIPECSGAMEHADTWETQEVHKATTFIIGQVQAKLIDFEDIYNVLK